MTELSDSQLSDIEFLKSPLQWLRLMCPIVNRERIRNHEKPDCAVVLAGLDDNGKVLVVYENMYNLDSKTAYENATKEYMTPEELIVLGWEVD